MDNKEATPVEVEESLPPVLSKQTEQPEMPTQTGEVNVQKEQLEKSSRTEDDSIPVSYTHLDVYKRQHIHTVFTLFFFALELFFYSILYTPISSRLFEVFRFVL